MADEINKFPFSETKQSYGGGIIVAAAVIALGILIGAVLNNFSEMLANLSIVITICAAVLLPFYGKFNRKGPCPHCGTCVSLFAVENAVAWCGGCARRLLLRSNRLYDVTSRLM
ncbi:MAG: hypothetical protein V4691_00830 [Pseudomonadota bacterium]